MKIQFNFNGRFRIVAEDGTAGEWADYVHLAVLNHSGKIYIAATDYGLLPEYEKVYQLPAPLPTTMDHSMDYIDNQGVDRSLASF